MSSLVPRAWSLILILGVAQAVGAQSGNSAAQEGPPASERPARVLHHQPETLLEFAMAGGWMMIPLCACSVVCLAFFLERLVMLRRGRVFPRRLVTGLRSLLRQRPFDRKRALATLASDHSPAAAVVKAAVERLDLPREQIEAAVRSAADRQVYELRQRLWIFAVLSTTTPLLGLLGTVIGLVRAFREVAVSGLGAGATLAPGIYEALIATVSGLAVAIPSFGIYYWLQARVDRYVHDIDCLVTDLVDASELRPAPALG